MPDTRLPFDDATLAIARRRGACLLAWVWLSSGLVECGGKGQSTATGAAGSSGGGATETSAGGASSGGFGGTNAERAGAAGLASAGHAGSAAPNNQAGAPDNQAGGSEGGAPSGTSAQGAMLCQLTAVSPPSPGKMCPSGAAYTFDVPTVLAVTPNEALDQSTYLHDVVDGQDGASVSCRVAGAGSTFAFQGVIQLGARALVVEDGTVSEGKGLARIRVSDSTRLAGSLASPAASCTIDVSTGGLQVHPGAIWARFSCPFVAHEPSDTCAAQGYFVLENCVQD